MVNIFGTVVGFASFFQSRPQGDIKIDNVAFRLHYDFTSGFFFLATALLSLNDMFGSNIQCKDVNGADAPKAVVQYCWVSGTFTVPGVDEIHRTMQGIGSHGGDHEERLCKQLVQDGEQPNEEASIIPKTKDPEVKRFKIFQYSSEDELHRVTWENLTSQYYTNQLGRIPLCKTTHSYYQWVPFLFVFQGFLFMIPHKIWETVEEGKMRAISEGVALGNRQNDREDRSKVVRNVTNYIIKEAKSSGHKKYAYGFWSCWILNLINVISNFIILDSFIDGNFFNLGTEWIQASGDEGDRLLKEIFPRMTSCLWKQHGTAGHFESTSYLCILATNIIIEKVFVFLWFWLVFLIIVSACVTIYYGFLFFSSSYNVREYFLAFAVRTTRKRLRWNDNQGTLKEEKMENRKVNRYLTLLPSTNFFFLYLLAKNLDHNTLQEILKAVAEANNVSRDDTNHHFGEMEPEQKETCFSQISQEGPVAIPSAPKSPENEAKAMEFLGK